MKDALSAAGPVTTADTTTSTTDTTTTTTADTTTTTKSLVFPKPKLIVQWFTDLCDGVRLLPKFETCFVIHFATLFSETLDTFSSPVRKQSE